MSSGLLGGALGMQTLKYKKLNSKIIPNPHHLLFYWYMEIIRHKLQWLFSITVNLTIHVQYDQIGTCFLSLYHIHFCQAWMCEHNTKHSTLAVIFHGNS